MIGQENDTSIHELKYNRFGHVLWTLRLLLQRSLLLLLSFSPNFLQLTLSVCGLRVVQVSFSLPALQALTISNLSHTHSTPPPSSRLAFGTFTIHPCRQIQVHWTVLLSFTLPYFTPTPFNRNIFLSFLTP